jgi:GPH family glycoside/pentoside/hexuronide:cation symporter
MADNSARPAGQLSLSRIIVYALGTLPVSMLGISIAVYLPPYLASHLGMGLVAIGGVWAFVRLVDIGVDPLIGMLMDRTRTPYGRYRVWLAAGTPVLMFSVYMLFMAPVGISPTYLAVWLFILYIGNSIMALSHSAWRATLATAYDERSRVFGIVTAVGVLAAVSALIAPIAAGAFGLSSAQGVQAMGWMVIVGAPFAVGASVWFTPERITTDIKTDRFPLLDYWDIVKKPEMIRLVLSQVALTLGPGWMSAMYIFTFRDVLGFTSSQSTILLLLYVLAGVAGAPLTARFAMRWSKHRTLMVTTTAYSLGLCAIFIFPRGSFLVGVPMMLWCGFMAAGFDLMVGAMMADVGDEIRLHQGKERISLLYALTTLAAKVAAAVAIVLTYPLLARLGYNAVEGAHNTAAAIHGLKLAFVLGPIVFVMLGGACFIGWKLDAKRHAGVRAALDARDGELDAAAVREAVHATQAHIVLAAETDAPPAPDRVVLAAETEPR